MLFIVITSAIISLLLFLYFKQSNSNLKPQVLRVISYMCLGYAIITLCITFITIILIYG